MKYGRLTVMRAMVRYGVRQPPDAVQTDCPYCGRPCWKLDGEDELIAEQLRGDATAACTECALRRHCYQREMDAERAAREGT